MYTGLIRDVGSVLAVDETPDGAVVSVETTLAGELATGDSISLNGVCLTATELTGAGFQADMMHETLSRSTLGDLKRGDQVNLERPLRVGDRLDGHFVQGHVDGVATVSAVQVDGFARVVTLSVEPSLMRYVVEKGSIAVDGVSLTVAGVGPDSFDVSLIPETQERTTLGQAAVGRRFNIEVDILVKHVARLML